MGHEPRAASRQPWGRTRSRGGCLRCGHRHQTRQHKRKRGSEEARKRRTTPMLKIEKSIEINAPVETVFAYTADLTHLPAYFRGVERVSKVRRLPNQRYSFEFVDKIAGERFVATGECTELVPNERLVVQLHAEAEDETLTTTFERLTSSATRMICVEEYIIHGGFLGDLGEAFLAEYLHHAGEMTNAALKARIEASSSAEKATR